MFTNKLVNLNSERHQHLWIKEEFLNILEKRLENKNSPGDYVAKLWHEKFNGSVEQTVSEIIAHIWEKTKK